MIAVIDYGMGNLRSVEKGFEKAGVRVQIATQPEEVDCADGIVLPGVGAFADAMENLNKSGMTQAIKKAINQGKPFFGICLGLQLLFEASEEWGYNKGLGIFPGMVRRLTGGLKVPHMGWNQVKQTSKYDIFEDVPDNSSFYYVHSYYVEPGQQHIVAGTTDYGIDFAAAVSFENIFAIQFHPEKSSVLGLHLLRNFGRIVNK